MRQFLMSGSVRGAACKGRPYRDFKVNQLFQSPYGSVLGVRGSLLNRVANAEERFNVDQYMQ